MNSHVFINTEDTHPQKNNEETKKKRISRWATLKNDGYIFEHLCFHLYGAGNYEDLKKLLLDFEWLQAKLNTCDINSLLNDYKYLQEDDELEQARQALQLSAHILTRDKSQLSSQLYGRLLSKDLPGINKMLEQVKATVPLLRPKTPSLMSPENNLLRTMEGHSESINTVAVTQGEDEKLLAISGSHDNTLKIWDLSTGKEIKTLSGHFRKVTAVAVTPNGRLAVSASEDETLIIWDLKTGEKLKTLTGHSGDVTAVSITPDGRFAVSASEDDTLKVWDLSTGREVKTMSADFFHSFNAVKITPDGKFVIFSGGKGVIVWDFNTGEEIMSLYGHSELITALAVSPNGRIVVSASYDKNLNIWDLETRDKLGTLEGHSQWVNAVAITPDGKRVVSASLDKTLKIWDLNTGEELKTLSGHASNVKAVAITPDGKMAISASHDNTLKIWNLDGGNTSSTISKHSSEVKAVAVMSDGKMAVSVSDDTLKLWDLYTGKEVKTCAGNFSWITSITPMPDGKQAIFVSDDTLKLWDLIACKEVKTLSDDSNTNIKALTPDGKRAISLLSGDVLKIWDLYTGNELKIFELTGHYTGNGKETFTNYYGEITAIVVSGDGKIAISGSSDGTLKIWDLNSGNELKTLTGHSSTVTIISIAPDCKLAVSGSHKTLKVWDLEAGKELKTFIYHGYGFNNIAVSPDGMFVVSVSFDSLTIWDINAGKEPRTLVVDRIKDAVVTSDGRYVASVSQFGKLDIWDLYAGELLKTLFEPLSYYRYSECYTKYITLTSDGKYAVLVTETTLIDTETTLRIWDLEKGELLHTLSEYSSGSVKWIQWISSVKLTSDGKIGVFTLYHNNAIQVWDLNNKEIIETFYQYSKKIKTVVPMPTGIRVISEAKEKQYDIKTMKIWELSSGRELVPLAGQFYYGNRGIAATPDGKYAISIVSSNENDDENEYQNMLNLWNLTTGELMKTFSGSFGQSNSLAITSDARWAISAAGYLSSTDSVLKVWDLTTGSNVASFSTEAPLTSCAVSPDALTIIAGDQFGNVHFLSLENAGAES